MNQEINSMSIILIRIHRVNCKGQIYFRHPGGRWFRQTENGDGMTANFIEDINELEKEFSKSIRS